MPSLVGSEMCIRDRSKKVGLDNILRFLENSRTLMRVDFNVPLKDGKVSDPNRIVKTLPSIKKILEQNCKSLVLMSHLGRPDGKIKKEYSMKPLVPTLEQLLGTKVHFIDKKMGKEVVEQVKSYNNGEVILLENLRFNPEEEGKYKDAKGNKVKVEKEKVKAFSKNLSALGDIYVNDAFGTCHRAHASIVGINHKIRAAGYLLKNELEYFSKALESPEKPFLVILGGAKVKDKIQLIQNLLDKVDEMIIGGGMAYTFLKKMYNMEIGKSLYDEEGFKIVDQILKKAEEKGVKLHFPVDCVAADKLKQDAETKICTVEEGIPEGWSGLDCGPQTRMNNAEVIARAKTIVWNGPQGLFEIPKFSEGSIHILKEIVKQTEAGCLSIVGGGDTVNLVKQQKANKKISHVSTGGGASLELLEGKELPGIKILSNLEDLDNL
eukprot:TRINITY_DN55_c0_g1_i1.p1 TRINITY_DN55_c0_g1~~TRINITY_DN55_c0_g1_i1.p1  ORF type:complete len:436 (+),score=107.29 TRINITY_DN55_c0_g1_i1:128-1435(+)